MSVTIKSDNKYICKDKEKLKLFMKEQGFIFKNSSLQNDEYFVSVDESVNSGNSCIRLRKQNNKDIILSFNGNIKNVSSIDIEDKQNVFTDILQYDNIKSFLADLGYYKYVSINILKETYVKKEKEFYYNISIDTIEDVGEFIDYEMYSDIDNQENINKAFEDFEKELKNSLEEKIDSKYRDYSSKVIYNNLLKGDNLKRILVELDKILYDINKQDIENSIKNKFSLLNLELIEKIEQKGIEVSIVYSNPDEELVGNIKKVLDKIGYTPKFMNIREIKEIAVRETLIIEKQKKIDFSEAALMILNNYNIR